MRQYNDKTESLIPHSPPRFEELLTAVSQSEFAASLDFGSAFWQCPLSESSRKFSVFAHRGVQYCWTRSFQGDKNAPSAWSFCVQEALSQHNWIHFLQLKRRAGATDINGEEIGQDLNDLAIERALFLFVDDLFLHSNKKQIYYLLLEFLFWACLSYNLKLDILKCRLLSKRIVFLGMDLNLSLRSYRLEPLRCQAFCNWQFPWVSGSPSLSRKLLISRLCQVC